MQGRVLATMGALALFSAAQVKLEKKPITDVSSSDGPGMYREYCASCHGVDGRGKGPAVAALKIPPGDLTLMAKNNDGQFPAGKVMTMLGRLPGTEAHGSTDMPVWGNVFRESGQGMTAVQLRIYSLTRHLEELQQPGTIVKRVKAAKPVPLRASDITPLSGADMYRHYCASCHGLDGLGFGPAAKGLSVQLPDLTVLTRTHNGKFPDLHLVEILGARKGNTTAHGSREMPVWGNVFRAEGEDQARVQARITNLVEHLKTLQR